MTAFAPPGRGARLTSKRASVWWYSLGLLVGVGVLAVGAAVVGLALEAMRARSALAASGAMLGFVYVLCKAIGVRAHLPSRCWIVPQETSLKRGGWSALTFGVLLGSAIVTQVSFIGTYIAIVMAAAVPGAAAALIPFGVGRALPVIALATAAKSPYRPLDSREVIRMGRRITSYIESLAPFTHAVLAWACFELIRLLGIGNAL